MAITDLEPFRPYIDNFDLTEEQKLELINTIAMMAETVLDKHFRMNRADLLDSGQKPVDAFKASSNGVRHGKT
ncbi:hypothetical protein N9W34_00960 [Rickettsiales bacterium]|nr:hypothetical protein [Rickettsiales bacterium]